MRKKSAPLQFGRSSDQKFVQDTRRKIARRQRLRFLLYVVLLAAVASAYYFWRHPPALRLPGMP